MIVIIENVRSGLRAFAAEDLSLVFVNDNMLFVPCAVLSARDIFARNKSTLTNNGWRYDKKIESFVLRDGSEQPPADNLTCKACGKQFPLNKFANSHEGDQLARLCVHCYAKAMLFAAKAALEEEAKAEAAAQCEQTDGRSTRHGDPVGQ